MQLLRGKNHMALGKRKKRKNDQSVSGSVFETNAPVTVQVDDLKTTLVLVNGRFMKLKFI
jgi:hypothetical protein